MEKTEKTFCFSCGRPCHKKQDYCYGCKKIVCVVCSEKYDHLGKGKHGKKRSNRLTTAKRKDE